MRERERGEVRERGEEEEEERERQRERGITIISVISVVKIDRFFKLENTTVKQLTILKLTLKYIL